MSDQFDVFLSHAWGDHIDEERRRERPQRAGVERLRDALRANGLRVFYDEGSIDEFAPLADTIVEALRASKVLVAWCSDLYLSRPACASELTKAITWSVTSDEPRVLVVNTEPDVDHMPGPLRANLIPSAPLPDDGPGFGELVDNIATRCERVAGGLGEGVGLAAAEWFPEKVPSSTRFTGRFRELWDLHGILTSTALQSGKDARRGAVVSGMGGSGKSLLVLEYAHRFGAAWPGGVVFLTGHGFDRDEPDEPVSSADHAMSSLGSLASTDLGIDGVEQMQLGDVRAAIQERFRGNGPALWIVDDLADGADTEAWAAPMDDAATIFTTRVSTYDGLFEPLRLDQLSPSDAFQLLTRDHPPVGSEQKDAATTIAERLGCHALALDVTRCRVRSADDYAHLLERLEERTMATLERAGRRVGELAVDHTASIAATLESSIDDLDDHGRTVLDIGASFDSLPLPDDTMVGIVHALNGGDRFDAEDDTIDGLADLDKHSLAKRSDATTTIHRLVVDLARPASRLDRTTVLAAADAALAADRIEDQRLVRSRRAHYELAATLPIDPQSSLPDWLTSYELAAGQPRAAIRRGVELVALREARLGQDHPDTLDARWSLADARHSAGDLTRAIIGYQELLTDGERLFGPDGADTIAIRQNLALAYLHAGDLVQALALNELNDAACERVLGADHPDTLDSHRRLASAYLENGEHGRAITILEATLAASERALGADHPDTLVSREDLAGAHLTAAHLDVGDATRAMALSTKNLAEHERILGADHPDTLASRSHLAFAHDAAGDLVQAITHYETVLTDRERVLGPDHPDTLISRNHLANAYQGEGDHDKAIALHEAALAERERVLGPDHPQTLDSRTNVAFAYQEAGELTRAIALHEATLAANEGVHGPDHPATLLSREALAGAHGQAGDSARAIELYEAALIDRERIQSHDHPDVVNLRAHLAYACQEAGDFARAIELHQASLVERERIFGPDAPQTIDGREMLAGALREAGEYAEATALFETILADRERVLGPDHPHTVRSRKELADALQHRRGVD